MTLLTIGPTHSIAQTTAYALPAKAVWMKSGAAVETSLQETTGYAAVAASTTGVVTTAKFVRCTSTATLITLKAV